MQSSSCCFSEKCRKITVAVIGDSGQLLKVFHCVNMSVYIIHKAVAEKPLKAGKHVFCEKPITVNYELSCEMAEEANKRGLMLNIGVCNRYNKSIEMLEEMNREGKFGNIYHVYCSFRSFRSIPGLVAAYRVLICIKVKC